MSVGQILLVLIRNIVADRAELAAKNLALRKQLAILEQRSKQPRLRKRDRIFRAWLSRSWSDWRSALVIFQAETVVRWHQQGFRLYRRWKSRGGKVGRPRIEAEIRNLTRRMVVHFNVTANPTAGWTAQQVVEAFPEETTPRFPWQNPFVERLIGSIRGECLNHVIVLNERHLLRILRAYFDYYHHARTHLSLDHNSPVARDVEPPDRGKVIAIPQAGGLHHRYRCAA